MTQIIRVSSAEIQAVFTTWLATQIGVGVRLVILEGLSGVGKSWLTREPFISDGWASQVRPGFFCRLKWVTSCARRRCAFGGLLFELSCAEASPLPAKSDSAATSSATVSILSGIVRPTAFAVEVEDRFELHHLLHW